MFGKIKEFFAAVNGPFLIVLFAGIGTSIIALSSIVLYLLEHFPIAVWSFFFGLIIASAVIVYRKIKIHNLLMVIFALLGAAIAYWITVASPAETPEDLWFIFICGCIAICAMILPGISGSFILLLMGKYEFILGSLKELKIGVLVTFLSGCVIGISVFAHLLDWLLKKYHDYAVALLAGFMIGSLNKVWPWKKVLTTRIDSHGMERPVTESNISPFSYLEVTGNQPFIPVALLLCLVGFFVVYYLELRSQKNQLKR